MTVSSETARNAVVGDGTTGPYTMGITVAAEGDFLVTQVVTATGVETPLVLTTDYTVNTALTEVTTVVAVPASEKLVFTRSLTLTQNTDYLANNPFPADTTETALDRLTYINQQQQEELARVVKFPVGTGITLPVEITGDPIDDQVMKWDASTGKFTWETLGTGSFLGNELVGDLDCNGYQIQWSKGADVASDTALPVLTDGNYFDVTGTTTVTSIDTTGGPGTLIKLHFDGALILTHHATDLILPGGSNITTAAGDEAEFIEYATGDYRCTNYSKADGTALTGGSNIAVSDLADGTDGELITWDSSGNATTVAVGTADHVLTSNGAGAAPTFQAAGGGAWTLIESQTASTSSSIDFTTGIDSTYAAYAISISQVDAASSNVKLWCRVSDDGGSTWKAGTNYRYATLYWSNVTTQGQTGSAADAQILVTGALNTGANAVDDVNGILYMFGPSDSARYTSFQGHIQHIDNTIPTGNVCMGSYKTAASIDGLQFLMSSGNITSGRFTLYGIKHT